VSWLQIRLTLTKFHVAPRSIKDSSLRLYWIHHNRLGFAEIESSGLTSDAKISNYREGQVSTAYGICCWYLRAGWIGSSYKLQRYGIVHMVFVKDVWWTWKIMKLWSSKFLEEVCSKKSALGQPSASEASGKIWRIHIITCIVPQASISESLNPWIPAPLWHGQ